MNLVCSLAKVEFYPDLDEEIDYLRAVIEKQEVTEIKTTKPKQTGKNPESKLKNRNTTLKGAKIL